MFHSFLNAFWCEEDGQDLVEYALLMAFIGLAAVSVLTTINTNLKSIWGAVNTSISSAKSAATK